MGIIKFIKQLNKTQLKLLKSLAALCFAGIAFIMATISYGWMINSKNSSADDINFDGSDFAGIYVSQTAGSVDIGENGEYSFENFDINFHPTPDILLNTGEVVLFPASYAGEAGDNSVWSVRKSNSNGQAIEETGQDTFLEIDSSLINRFVLERTIYLATPSKKDVLAYLSKVQILQGTDITSSLYKSVRIEISGINSEGVAQGNIYRNHNDGSAFPAISANSTLSYDPSYIDGDISSTGDGSFVVKLPGRTNENYYVVPITIKIWLEGQNENCISEYAGSGFFIKFSFNVLYE